MTPFFSVILPIYNVATYLERCIQSVLSQDFSDYEMILVDDGSTDSSGQICDEYASKYDHIRVIHKENGGLSSARNAGMAIAKGEYIWWVDSDDWIEAGALSKLHHILNDNLQCDVIKFNYIRVAERETAVYSCSQCGIYTGLNQKESLMRYAFLKTSSYILSAWSHVYRRDFLVNNKLSFVSERKIGSEDYLFNLQVLLCAQKVCVINETLYYYEQRLGSLSQRYKMGLPQKYTALYNQLIAFYHQAGEYGRYKSYINTFYAWHLLHGVCIPNEYYVTPEHTLLDGRKNIISFLRIKEFRLATRSTDLTFLNWKQKIQLIGMRLCFEPLFYWLYVKK